MKKTKEFCLRILANIGIKNVKAFTNLVISLSSYESARSVTELSESALFHHQYSSIRDGIAGVGENESEQKETMKRGRDICLSQVDFSGMDRVLLQTDASSIEKPHSVCLEDRQYVKINNNVIRQNQPISIGYPISLVNMSMGVGKWSVPIDMRRIHSQQSATQCAVEQMEELLVEPPFANLLTINTLDSGYGNASYMSPVYKHKGLVNLVRFRHARKVYLPYASPLSNKKGLNNEDNKGAPCIYGDKFYLTDESDRKTYCRKGQRYEVMQESIFEVEHQDYVELEGSTSKGRALNVQIWRWNDLLIRSKDGHNMKNKPFDLIGSRVSDAQTGELVFEKTMFTAIHGDRKSEITTEQAFRGYRKRYDIEPAIKFAKQKLLLDKYQTPCQQHFDNWLVVVMLSFWMLFSAKEEVEYVPKKWRQYKERANKQKQAQADQVDQAAQVLTPSQVRQGAQALFLTFEAEPFLPKTSNKGKGRQKDTIIGKRIRHPVVKKGSNQTKMKLTVEKME